MSHVRSRSIQAVVGLFIIVLLVQIGHAQALPPGADAFVASANALAKSASERVELGRATTRISYIKLLLTNKLIAAKASDTIKFTDLSERVLLCNVLGDYVDVATRRNYIQALATKIDETGKPTQIENLIGAVKSLFAGQSLDIRGPISTKAEMEKLVKNATSRCEADIKTSPPQYYGTSITPAAPPPTTASDDQEPKEAPVVFFGELTSLINVFVGIITPVVVGGAKFVDEQRRREAIRVFLSNQKNRQQIIDNGQKLADEISRFVLAKRQKLAGSFVETAAVLRNSEINLTKLDACKAGFDANKFATRASGAPSDDFVVCWRAAWMQIERPVAALIKAADEYDQLADAGDSNNAKKAFTELSTALDAIAEGSVTDPAELWRIATRLVAFGQKVEAATSKENREKINKAIDDLVKVL
jgi:hypothetical protein